MADDLRITLDELKRRMESGENFVFIDTRNPQAWAESDVKMPGAIRIPADKVDEYISKIPKEKPIVTYCT